MYPIRALCRRCPVGTVIAFLHGLMAESEMSGIGERVATRAEQRGMDPRKVYNRGKSGYERCRRPSRSSKVKERSSLQQTQTQSSRQSSKFAARIRSVESPKKRPLMSEPDPRPFRRFPFREGRKGFRISERVFALSASSDGNKKRKPHMRYGSQG